MNYFPQYHERVSGPEMLSDGTLVMTAWFDELPTCLAQAETAEGAVERLWDGLPAFIDMLKEHGQPVPLATNQPQLGSISAGTPGAHVIGFTMQGFTPHFATR